MDPLTEHRTVDATLPSTDRERQLERTNALRNEVASGLLDDHAQIAPKFFYDALGSTLFEAICQLPEYYLTRTEDQIFQNHLSDLTRVIAPGCTFIDLGAGNCAKAARLFSHLHPGQYVPVDISVEHLRDAVQRLQQRFPHIEMSPLGMDFSTTLALPDWVRNKRRMFFYPGSSIGNFYPDQARTFLQQIRAACDQDDALLIGVDLVKDDRILTAAYEDELGVTASFNRNVLRNINQLLGADFALGEWSHLAEYNHEKSRIEMYLVAQSATTVSWENNHRHFMGGERIHTENSYKYTLPAFLALLSDAGFEAAQYWTDRAEWFAVIYANAT